MPKRNELKQSEHDVVIEASARTFGQWQANGYVVSTNPDGKRRLPVGPADNPRYPDIVVWMPKYPGSTNGTAEVIEEIESEGSVTEQEADQWAGYASLSVSQFNLVVPRSKKADALLIIQKKRILGISKIQGYYFSQGRIYFD